MKIYIFIKLYFFAWYISNTQFFTFSLLKWLLRLLLLTFTVAVS